MDWKEWDFVHVSFLISWISSCFSETCGQDRCQELCLHDYMVSPSSSLLLSYCHQRSNSQRPVGKLKLSSFDMVRKTLFVFLCITKGCTQHVALPIVPLGDSYYGSAGRRAWALTQYLNCWLCDMVFLFNYVRSCCINAMAFLVFILIFYELSLSEKTDLIKQPSIDGKSPLCNEWHV